MCIKKKERKQIKNKFIFQNNLQNTKKNVKHLFCSILKI